MWPLPSVALPPARTAHPLAAFPLAQTSFQQGEVVEMAGSGRLLSMATRRWQGRPDLTVPSPIGAAWTGLGSGRPPPCLCAHLASRPLDRARAMMGLSLESGGCLSPPRRRQHTTTGSGYLPLPSGAATLGVAGSGCLGPHGRGRIWLWVAGSG